MSEITINTPNQTSLILCEKNVFQREIPALLNGHKNFVLTDSNVYALYRADIAALFGDTPIYVLPAGESSKTHIFLFDILQAMIKAELHRNSVLFALGGGVVGDIGGLAAALYMRGIHCVQIPTTLLAQVDSSVGGKTAVDMGKVKNIVGTFYQPEKVLVDNTFLQTLPAREIRCGLGEIIKYGGLNGKILDKLVKNSDRLFDLEFLGEITADCIEHKADVVRKDEKETGLRKSLNMGHTTGHALELYFGDKSHGEFVLIGMYYELKIALAEGLVKPDYAGLLNGLIMKILDVIPVYDSVAEAVSYARLDKKNSTSDIVSLIVPVAYGEYAELKLPYEKYLAYMKKICGKMKEYTVKKIKRHKKITVEVPGSKSITNRALLLAALGDGKCVLQGVLFSEDSRAFLSCLNSLGFNTETDEIQKTASITGMGGVIPNRKAEINVCGAGTAARFLTVMLAFAGGEYTLRSSEQMEKRPMRPLLDELVKAGVKIEYLKEYGCFPFVLRSDGVKTDNFSIDTDVGSQFASALLMNAVLLRDGARILLTGGRREGAYIGITLRMMEEFGVSPHRTGTEYFIAPVQKYRLSEYRIEPDFSAACYFFAAGAILNVRAKVKKLYLNAMQGDKKFLSVLESMGCKVEEESDGIVLTGSPVLNGVTVNMNDFSDQALTLAAIAPFADSPTVIGGTEHIRKQECDRIHAMVVNLRAMGVKVEERSDGAVIYPCKRFLPARIQTFRDHRVAMSFAIAGLKCGGLTIEDPLCCKKTFENFFGVLDGLYTEGEG